jgi:hypothetical protein
MDEIIKIFSFLKNIIKWLRARSIVEKVAYFLTLSVLTFIPFYEMQRFGKEVSRGPDNSVNYFKLHYEWQWDGAGIAMFIITIFIIFIIIFGGSTPIEKDSKSKFSNIDDADIIDAEVEDIEVKELKNK